MEGQSWYRCLRGPRRPQRSQGKQAWLITLNHRLTWLTFYSSLQLSLHSLSLVSASAPGGEVTIDLRQPKEQLEALKKNPLNIKEGVDYSVKIRFAVGNEILSGLKYVQVVKRAGVTGKLSP